MRDCSLLLIPFVPSEAAEWVVAADEFEARRLTYGLTEVRVRAWRFHDSRRDVMVLDPDEQVRFTLLGCDWIRNLPNLVDRSTQT